MATKSKSLPAHTHILDRYADLERYARGFAAGHLQSLILIGSPGVGKSAMFREVLGGNVCWIAGNATPFGIYLKAYEHLNQPLVLDDVDELQRNPHGVRLLKSLCQSDPVRRLGWHSRARDLQKMGVPQEFTTTSSVALITNSWETLNSNVAAIEDRAHLLAFEPTPLEIHLQSARWFWDQEIFDCIANHLPLLENHSLRLYVRAWELKSAGMDWRATILAQCFSGVSKIVATMRADDSFRSEEARVQAFVQGGHGCRSTYFNHLRRVGPMANVPKIELETKVPPRSRAEATVANERCRRLMPPNN